MNTIPCVDSERTTQNRIVNLLHDYCDYEYLGSKNDSDNSPIIPELLSRFLHDKYPDIAQTEIDKIVREIESQVSRVTDNNTLYESNLKIYELLRYGINLRREDGHSATYQLIDWEDAGKNIWSLAEEVTIRRNIEEYHTRRPDVVIYVNGFALAVFELKKSTVSVKDGIRQQIRNNKEITEISHFFATAQLLLAGNDSEGVYYGTILTPEKFWLRWKEPTGKSYPSGKPEPDVIEEKFSRQQFSNELDRSTLQLLDPVRFLTLVHDCVIYDGGVKKVCRPNQYFAFESAKPRIRRKQSGIIWHSQGAGKSLMMVWLAQWIIENVKNAKVVIITDRDELDKQIENGFKDARMSPVRARSGQQLLRILSGKQTATEFRVHPDPTVICTLIHKFGIAGGEDTVFSLEDKRLRGKRSPEQYMEALAAKLPKDFKPQGNFFVFVDECHRTQGGVLNRAMKRIMGDNVMLIGFTGTPLLRKQKSRLTSRENFGNYIHTYTFKEAVEDNVVLDLRYEAREVEQELGDEEAVDALFENLSRPLSPKAKEELKRRWAVMKNLFSSKDRICRIVADIVKDMILKPALCHGWGNAMLVCESIYQAFRYWEAFQATPLRGHCSVVSSFDGMEVGPDEASSGETESEAEYKARKAKEMFGSKTPEEFEEWAKDQFINHPADMKLLIVVSKLLTGFDAPSATYLYIDKTFKEGPDLFQAICRVNRQNDEHAGKEFGYIIDFKQLFRNIKQSITDFTGGVFSDFDKTDVEGLLTDRFETARRDLDAALERVEQLCEPVKSPKTTNEFFDYFVFDPRVTQLDEEEAATIASASLRERFYSAVKILITRYSAIALDMRRCGYTEQESESIFQRVTTYDQLCTAIMRRADDRVDMKMYDQTMRLILDDYVEAKHSKILAALEDISFLDLIMDGDSEEAEEEAEEVLGGKEGVASTMTANVRRVINRKRESNPAEYQKFSERLNRLLAEYRQGVIEYKAYLKCLAQLARELRNRTTDSRLDTEGKRALYDNLGEDADFAIEVYNTIKANAKVGFRNSGAKLQKLQVKLDELSRQHPFDVDCIMNIIKRLREF